MKRYYSVKEASKLLGFSTNTIYKYLDEGKIQSKRLGKGRFKIPYTELEKYLTPEQTLPQLQEKAEVIQKISETYYEKEQTRYIEPTLGDSYFMTIFLGLTMFGGGLVKILLVPHDNISTLITTILFVVCGVLMILRAAFYKTFLSVRQSIKIFALIVIVITSFELVFTKNYTEFAFIFPFAPLLLHRILRVQFKKQPLTFYKEFLIYSVVRALVQVVLFSFVPDVFQQFDLDIIVGLSKDSLITIWMICVAGPLLLLITPFGINRRAPKILFAVGGVFALLVSMVMMSSSSWVHAYYLLLYSYFAMFIAWWTIGGISIARFRLTDIAGIFTWMCISTVLGVWTIYSLNNYQFDLEFKKGRSQIVKVVEGSNQYFMSLEEGMLSVMQKSELSTLMTNASASTEDFQFVAEKIFNNISDLQRVLILDKEGKSLAIYPRIDNYIGQDFSYREYFIRTKATKRVNVSTVYDSVLGIKAVGVTQPMFVNNEFVGMVYAGPSLIELTENYQQIASFEKVYAFDTTGKYVIHPDKSKLGSDVPELIKSFSSQSLYKDSEKFIVYDTAVLNNWTFYIERNLDEVSQRNKVAIVAVSTILFANALVSMAASIALSRKVEKDD